MSDFAGIYPAIVTPFDDAEELDLDGFTKVAEHLYDQGVHGIYICGSTGEGLMMTVDERKRVAERAVEVSRGRGRVIAHIGCVAARDTFELARHAESAGVDAVSSVPPVYFKCSEDEVRDYYADIAAACALPLFVYYIPQLVNFEITPEFLDRLIDIPTVRGMKFTAPDHFLLNRLAMMAEGRDFIIFNGADQLLISGLSMGAGGGIGGTYNYQPRNVLGIYDAFNDGDLDRARDYQYRTNRQIELFFQLGGMRWVKGLMNLQGLPAGRCRRPLGRPSQEEMDRARKLLDEHGWPE